MALSVAGSSLCRPLQPGLSVWAGDRVPHPPGEGWQWPTQDMPGDPALPEPPLGWLCYGWQEGGSSHPPIREEGHQVGLALRLVLLSGIGRLGQPQSSLGIPASLQDPLGLRGAGQEQRLTSWLFS